MSLHGQKRVYARGPVTTGAFGSSSPGYHAKIRKLMIKDIKFENIPVLINNQIDFFYVVSAKNY